MDITTQEIIGFGLDESTVSWDMGGDRLTVYSPVMGQYYRLSGFLTGNWQHEYWTSEEDPEADTVTGPLAVLHFLSFLQVIPFEVLDQHPLTTNPV